VKVLLETVKLRGVCLLYLVLLQAAQGLVSLLLEGDDDESHEDVHKKEREDHKVDDVEDGHLYPVARAGTHVFEGGVHRVLQDAAGGASRR